MVHGLLLSVKPRYSQSVLSLLADAQRPNVSVGVVEQLKEALVDHVLGHVHKKQRHHVLPETRDVLDMLPPVGCVKINVDIKLFSNTCVTDCINYEK